ncbi:IS1182 family transposase [Rubellimicrobium aerolatum]|uniref:IS1182 family transposase n=1 Tax=Rubellimicrobium aerolatum TaxID=490979 RepID=A0ABW0SEM7_9RHOB|nr:IS1182 family transposase [Rubellimicrobium aerolatum]MBP1806909.1 transposase [Rubellimicrobium aerolatum]
MMGRLVERAQLFYEFSLERHMPAEHLLRRLDAALDLSWLRAELAPFYSAIGRPSIDPELMIRMLLVGYCYGVRSERRLCDEVHLNLGYRWFCRLGLDGAVPDHSTFSKARHGRFREAEVFRRVFERVVGACMGVGLVGGEGFAIDASVIEADASYAQRVEGPTLPPERADPASATRPVREYLAALDVAAARVAGAVDGMDGQDQPERLAAEPAPAKSLSLTDPAAAWTSKGARKASFAYAVNYLVDLKRAIIVDTQASPARWTEEVATTALMIERTRERFGLQPSRLAADSAYGSGRLVGWLMARGIEPHVPLLDRVTQTKGVLTRAAFTFDRERDVYICPAGHELATSGHVAAAGFRQYRAKPTACGPCALKPRCTSGVARLIGRNVHEDEREHVRQIAGTPAFKRSTRERRKVEMLFAHLKRNLGLRRLRLRGPTGAGDEFLLAATAQNLRRLARSLAAPPPASATAPA